MLRMQEMLNHPWFLIMSKLHGLDAYGYVVNAWLDGELETSGLSEIPALGWFWSDLLKHRMWMIDELENWAGIINEQEEPPEGGDGPGNEDQGFGPDHGENGDGPGDPFDPEAELDSGEEDIDDNQAEDDELDPDAELDDGEDGDNFEDIALQHPDNEEEDAIFNNQIDDENNDEFANDVDDGHEGNDEDTISETQGNPDIAENYSSTFVSIANKLSGTDDYDSSNFREFFHGSNGAPAHSEANKATLAELSFMGDLSEHFDDLGNFTGTVKLVDEDGTVIENNIPSFTDPFSLMYPDSGIMPGMREDYIFVFVSEEIQEGYSFEVDFKIEGETEGSTDVVVGPLLAESYPISDFWSLDAFQLDVRIGEAEYSINGMEEAEGYFDINNNQIVLNGTNLGLDNGVELGFAEHEGLPNSIKSFATYKVSNLEETGRETIFNLTNKTGKVVSFNDDKISERLESLSENSYGANDGLRMAVSKTETQFRIDWDMAGDIDFISLDPLITEDFVVETLNPDAADGDVFTTWTKLELNDVKAAFSEIEISLKQEGAIPSLEATDYAIPESWEIRMSYDDLIKETIPADALASNDEQDAEQSINANETYLFFDKSVFDVVIGNEDLTSATLSIGPAGASQITLEDIHQLESLEVLIGSITDAAAWAQATDVTWTKYIESHFMPGYGVGHDEMGGDEGPNDMPEGQPPIGHDENGMMNEGEPDMNEEHQDIHTTQLVMQEEETEQNDVQNVSTSHNDEIDNTGEVPITGNQPNHQADTENPPGEEEDAPNEMQEGPFNPDQEGTGGNTEMGGGAESTEVVNPGLKLSALTDGEGLSDFSVTLTLQHQDGELDRVYNSIWFGKLNEEGTAVAADPDGFSLITRSWQNWEETNVVTIDRYGDGLGVLAIDDSVDYPEWSDYFPNVFFETPWHLPWDQQRLAAKTLKVEGKAFDSGDDLLLNVEIEIPKENEAGHTHSEYRHYTLLVDIYGGDSNQESPLSDLEKEELFMMSGGGFKDPYGPQYESEIHIPLALEEGETAFTPELLTGHLQQKLESFFDGLELYESFDFGSVSSPGHNSITDGQQFRALVDLYAESKGLEAVVTEVNPYSDDSEDDDTDNPDDLDAVALQHEDEGQEPPQGDFEDDNGEGQEPPQGDFEDDNGEGQQPPQDDFEDDNGEGQQPPQGDFEDDNGEGQQPPQDDFEDHDGEGQEPPQGDFEDHNGEGQEPPQGDFEDHDGDPADKDYGPGLEITVGDEIFTWNVSGHGGDPDEGTGPHATRNGQGLSFTDQELESIKALDEIELFADQVLTFGDIVDESDEFRTLKSSTIDFNIPEDGEKPLVDMWGYVVFDESNDLAFMEAEEAYNSSFHTESYEWVNNFGLRKPGFEWAWTDPLGPDSDSNRRIQVDYVGMDELAKIEANGSTYKPGDIKLKIDKKLVDPEKYDVRVEWGHQLIITLKEEGETILTPESKVSFELSDDVYDEEGVLTKAGHGFVDVNGQRLEAGEKVKVDNWAAFSQMGFDFSEQIMLNPETSVVKGKKITLEFYGDADFSTDSEKATVPEKADFQFYSYDPARGVETSLTLSEEDIAVDGKKLVFTLSESVPSGTFVEATYDPSLSTFSDSSTEADNAFTNLNGVAAEPFYFLPLKNESPDEQGPHIMYADVAGKMMHLQLEDPNGIYIGEAELSNENLPNPSNFSLEATDSDNKTKKITATSVILNRWGDLEFQLDSAVTSTDVVKLTYSGNSLKDSLKNSSKIRDFEVWNNSVDFSFEDANSWFLLNDLTNVVFNDGLYIQDNGNVSSLSSNFQFIDEYVFKLKEFSKVTIDLTDVNGETLDDDGDANLDFVLENERTFDYVGGSFNSKQDDWQESPTNDERNVSFQLPAGEWRLIVEHGETWNEISQDYQLKISTSAATFEAEKTFTEDSTSHDFNVSLDNYRKEKIFNVDVAGNLTFSLTTPEDFEGDVFMNLFDLGGQWLNESWTGTFSQYVEAGSYRLEINSWTPPTPDLEAPSVAISATLDTSISLDVDTDTKDSTSGSITVDGVPTEGELNSLDPEDWWTLKLNGGKIYTLRATDFTEDVNLVALNNLLNYEEWSVNWGTETVNDDGSFTFTPSDETLLFDLSTDKYESGKTYQFTVNPHIYSFNPTSYSLIAKSHDTLEAAQTEISTGIVSYDDIFDSFFGETSDSSDSVKIDKNDLMGLAKLTEPTTDEVNTLKAALEKELGAMGQELSGNPIAFKSSLTSEDGSSTSSTVAVVVTKDVPESVSDQVSSENITELNNNEPAELTSTGSTEEFGAKEISELGNDTKDEAEDLTPISQPVDVSARSRSSTLSGFLAEGNPGNALQGENFNSNHASTTQDLGLQRIGIQLSDEIIAQLSDPEETRDLIWYRKPNNGDAFIFTYDSTTGTGALLEDSDSNGTNDVMALYVRDGGRGDDDKQVNGEIVSPGGLAFASLTAAAPDTTTTTVINEDGVAVEVETVLWKLDVDSDGIINALADGLAITRRHLEGSLETDPVLNQLVSTSGERTTESSVRKYLDLGIQTPDKVLDIDNSGTFDTSDLALILRQATGTFPSTSLSNGFSNDTVTHADIIENLNSLISDQQVT